MALGGRTVEELRSVISEAEFQKWMYVYSVYPFGERAAFYRSGMIASMIANQNRDPKKSKPLTAQDFMPKDPFAAKEKPSKKGVADVARVAAIFGGKGKKPS